MHELTTHIFELLKYTSLKSICSMQPMYTICIFNELVYATNVHRMQFV